MLILLFPSQMFLFSLVKFTFFQQRYFFIPVPAATTICCYSNFKQRDWLRYVIDCCRCDNIIRNTSVSFICKRWAWEKAWENDMQISIATFPAKH